jgi:ATP-binding cassette, subfamily B, bacterial PglK
MAVLEVIGIASILPFMHLAANPKSITQNEWLNRVYIFMGFDSYTSMLIFTGIAMLTFLMLANFFTAFTTWLQYKISWDAAHNLSTRLLRTYLDRPYSFFLHKNTSELQAKIVMEVGQVCSSVLIPISDLVARVLVVLVIFGLLFFVSPKTAIIVIGFLGSAYFIAYLLRKGLLQRLGEDRIKTNLDRFRSMSDALTGIKTSRVYGAQDYFYNRFETASEKHSHIHPRVQLISIVPKSIIEILAFGSVIFFTIYLLVNGKDLQSALPLLTLFAVSGYRLLPSLQRIFTAATKLKHSFPVVHTVYADLNYKLSSKQEIQQKVVFPPFSDSIKLDQITFNYEGTDQAILSNIKLEILKGQTVAFVGSTGSGKTTVIDLITGLLDIEHGQLLIDNQSLHTANASSWQRQIGYVQQDVFLFDGSVSNNIAIGIPNEQIDMERLKEVAKIAKIHNFIESELPNGYQSNIGERGVRISGGQKQRLGIARALYRNPTVLILDEATSALDGVTESKVIDSLKNLEKDLTIIIVAHRLSTVKHADCIYILEAGKVTGQGTYETLIIDNTIFKEMAEFS